MGVSAVLIIMGVNPSLKSLAGQKSLAGTTWLVIYQSSGGLGILGYVRNHLQSCNIGHMLLLRGS